MASGTFGGCDFSGDPPDYRELLAAHPGAVLAKYLSHTTWKCWEPDEIREVHALGGRVLLLVESTAARAIETRDDYAAGLADALDYIDQARALIAAVGHTPGNRPALIFAVDTDVPRARLGEVGDYFRGVNAGFKARGAHGEFKVGDYSSIAVLQYLTDPARRLVESTMLTYAWLYGFSPTRRSADLYQYRNGQKMFGGLVDLDQVNDIDNLGVWAAPGDPLNGQGDLIVALTSQQKADFVELLKDPDVRDALHEASFGDYNVDAKGHRRRAIDIASRLPGFRAFYPTGAQHEAAK